MTTLYPENVKLEDVVLKHDANLPEFASKICRFLDSLGLRSHYSSLPKAMISQKGQELSTDDYGTYKRALEAIQELRENNLTNYIDDKILLIMQTQTQYDPSHCDVTVNLKTSEIHTNFFPVRSKKELYEVLDPYIVKKDEVAVKSSDKQLIPGDGE